MSEPEAPYNVDTTTVATALGLHPATVRRMCELGELPAVRLGRGPREQYRIRADWLQVLKEEAAKTVAQRTATEKMRRLARANLRTRLKEVP